MPQSAAHLARALTRKRLTSQQQQQQQAMQAPGHAKWFLQGMDKMPEGFNPSQIGGGQAAGLEGGSAEGGMAPPAPGLGEQGPGMPPAPPQGEGMGEDAPMAGGPPLGGEPEQQQMPPPMGLLQLRGAGQRVQFKTTKGPITVTLRPDWAPRGVDHLSKLVKSGFYDNTAFFRVLTGFIAQWGIAADPSTNKKWEVRAGPREGSYGRQGAAPSPALTVARRPPLRTTSCPKASPTAAAPSPSPPPAPTRAPRSSSSTSPTTCSSTAWASPPSARSTIRAWPSPRRSTQGTERARRPGALSPHQQPSCVASSLTRRPRSNGPDQGRIMQEGNSYLKASFPDLDYCTSASFA